MNQVAKTTSKNYFKVANGVWGMKDIFVNFYMIQNEDNDNWVLVDTGLKTSASKIRRMAKELFGENNKPKAIILTHGHFDHVGSLQELLTDWHVPVYAHYLELPYLTGKSSYPPPDPSVGGGLMAYMANIYPNKPINIQGRVSALPDDMSVPFLKGWRYIHTPGHAPGHVSLYRDADKVLVAGDAFVTTKQESAIAVMLQQKKLSGPPAYFTYDWAAASDSVKALKVLAPEIVATGHGKPMSGKHMRSDLQNMHEHFYEVVVPQRGRYVNDPAITDVNGVMYVPPKPNNLQRRIINIGTIALAVAATVIVIAQTKKNRKKVLGFKL